MRREHKDAVIDGSSHVAANIPYYVVYTALKGFGLMAAMWVIYLHVRRGLRLAEAASVDVTFFVAAAFAVVPTGIVRERLVRTGTPA